jgi:putative transposase
MPWKESSAMDQRLLLVADYHRHAFSVAELCRRFAISRPTAYKWLTRYEAEGPAGLRDRGRRPHASPYATPPHVVEALLEARRRHPTWGAKKLLTVLRRRYPRWPWPARSTACELLKRHGLVRTRRRSRRRGHPGRPTTTMDEPNATWTADFKGQFKTRDGQYCYPLTVADGYSRYLLACQALDGTAHDGTKRVFRRLFQECGLPERIRTDNGIPFASNALRRLSRLSVWWIRLGITPELIEPASPQQNGRHERMHKTLKAETTRPPCASRPAQQRRFSQFRQEFNHERPHEALDQHPPATLYQPSPRPYPDRLTPIEYPSHYEVRRVSRNGGIRWQAHWVNVSHILADQYIGFEEIDNGVWTVYFGTLDLGRFHERTWSIEDALGRHKRRPNV